MAPLGHNYLRSMYRRIPYKIFWRNQSIKNTPILTNHAVGTIHKASAICLEYATSYCWVNVANVFSDAI